MNLTKTQRKIAIYVALGLILMTILPPYFWLLLDSFKTRVDRFVIPPKIFFKPTLSNYQWAFVKGPFAGFLLNTIIIATSSTLLALMIGVPSAYSLSKYKRNWTRYLFFFIVATRAVPALAIAIPLYTLYTKVGLFGTKFGIVLAHVLYNIAFVVLLMKDFFDAVPKDLEEAALIDGCSRLKSFFHISLPLSVPGLSATAVFCLVMSWNEFVYVFLLCSESSKTLPVAIPGLISLYGAKWGQAIAVTVVTTIPVLILVFFVQRTLVRGFTLGSLD